MNTTNQTDQPTMRGMFIPPYGIAEVAHNNACCFWENQNKILSAMQALSNGWFDRRHTGTYAALEAAERMCKAETPGELFREYQQWASGAFQRLTSDGLAFQQQFVSAVAAMSRSPAPTAGQAEGALPPTASRAADPSKAA